MVNQLIAPYGGTLVDQFCEQIHAVAIRQAHVEEHHIRNELTQDKACVS